MQHHATNGIPTGFLNKTVDVGGNAHPYSVYVPREYTPDRPWPLVLFLHGIGERGHDGLRQTDVGIGRAIRRHADWFPCIVVMPQCPDNVFWDKAFDVVDAAMAQTKREYRFDENRVYLTGLSMGGFAAWFYGAIHADEFAAIVPICGGGKQEDAGRLAKVPIWAFHGAKDGTVPVKRSRDMYEAVRQAGGNIKYTEFAAVEHNAWDPAYEDPETMKWMLEQTKKH